MRASTHRISAGVLACALTVAIAGFGGTAGAGAVVRPPTAPVPAVAVPFGNNVARVSWHKSARRGSRILGYTVWPYNGKLALPPLQYDATATTRIVTGLNNGSAYHFIVEARSTLGNSPPAQTLPTTVGAPLKPHAPSAVSNTAPNQLRVVFKAPKNGGAPITSYSVSCAFDIFKHTSATGPPVPFEGGFVIYVNGLRAGRTYYCRVKATNSRGSGPLSERSPSAAV
jgi:hypothetical protein